MKRLYLLTLMVINFSMVLAGTSGKKDATNQNWFADGGRLNLQLHYGSLKASGVNVEGAAKTIKDNWQDNNFFMNIRAIGGLQLRAPNGVLLGVEKGSLHLEGGFKLIGPDSTLVLNGMSIQQSSKSSNQSDLLALEIINDQGKVLFYLDNIHATIPKNYESLQLENMDVSVSEYLAAQLGLPELSGYAIGQAHIEANLTTPVDGFLNINEIEGNFCDGRPLWPGPGANDPKADVALISMQVQDMSFSIAGLPTGYSVFAPRSALKNVGGANGTIAADVAWYTKFSGSFQPYSNDQHPYLIWNMYREIDGRFEQIGTSGVKHAFLTINSNCSATNCGNSHILWPECEDVYGYGNNDSNSALGPRGEITAFSSVWDRDITGCTFFDADCNGSQDTYSDAPGQNRMVVNDSELSVPNVDYYFSSWYLVRDDIDIFNTMGYKQYDPAFTGSVWNFNSNEIGGFENGPASDQYVEPDTLDLVAGTASQRILQPGEGHLTVAVKVIDKGAGEYRYNYMIENHDYDPRVQSIEIPLSNVSAVNEFIFSDVDEDNLNNWVISQALDVLTLQAPAGNEIDWGTLYSFSFTTDVPPTMGEIILTGLENGGTQFISHLIVPSNSDLIFETGFE